MRVELNSDFHNKMRASYPFLKDIEDAIERVMGVSLEGIRSRDRRKHTSMARIIYVKLVDKRVTPSYHLSSYMNRDHGTLCYFEKSFDGMYRFDKAFNGVFNQVFDAFNKKDKDGNI